MNEAQKFISVMVLIIVVVGGIVASFELAQSSDEPGIPPVYTPVQLIPNAPIGSGEIRVEYPLEYYLEEA